MFKVNFFVPAENKEEVKGAMFKQGAGKIGNYACCSFESIGQGQYKPLAGAAPSIGEISKLTVMKEYKVEVVVEKDCLTEVIAALKATHPYETVAFEVYAYYFITGRPLVL